MDLTTYFWQANLVWILLYAVYWLFLRRETFFHWNRFYLLGASFFALIFPFLPIPQLFQEAVPEDQILLLFGGEEAETTVNQFTTTASKSFFTWENLLLAVYFLGLTFFAVRLFISLFKVFKLVFSQKRQKIKNDYYLIQTPPQTPIFSFLNILFWNENTSISEEEKAKILAHELVHIRQWHSLDVLFMEILTIAFWCNPVAWAYKKSLQAIHEYLADAKVLEKETSKTDYANLLVSQLLHTNTLFITTPFLTNHS